MTDLPPSPRRTWSQRQRYGFLEQRLYWEGAISRSDLIGRFGISAPQASDDVSNYMALAPGNVEFDRSRKMFVATANFEPRFIVPNARHYLTQLLLLADDAIDSGDSWLGNIPEHAAMPRVRRKLDPETLRPIVMAMHQRRAIEIRYQSMTAPEPTIRWIAPHSLVYDGARWHARSWCYNRSVFNDFVLARILFIGNTRASGIDALLDREWQETFTMKLAPHPDLSETQRQAIEMDYGMTNGVIGIPMRLCMTQYFERHYGLDLPTDSLPPWRRQVVLQNRSELDLVRETFGTAKEPA
ncbi:MULTISPECIES: WYL domain-containing protein [unclassified Pseudoxanthomonas]|uniref:WYL domain-containing protein n=1 Tax=unclassified Pseudoxanthomonas TaxID=2645906 RepID=UPI00307874DA